MTLRMSTGTLICAATVMVGACSTSEPGADVSRHAVTTATPHAGDDASAMTACTMLPDAEVSSILGTPVVGERDDSAGVTQCTYQPKGGTTPYVEVKISWGDGAVAMAGVGFLGRLEPGIAAAYSGVGDAAMVVGPAVMVRTGEDLVTLTFSGVDDVPAAAKRIIAFIRPQMGASSRPETAASADNRPPADGIPPEARDILAGVLGALNKQDGPSDIPPTDALDADGVAPRGRSADGLNSRSEPTFPPATSRAPRIPLVKGLTAVAAISDPRRGDYEPIKSVAAITSDAVTITFSADMPDGNTFRISRAVRRADLNSARQYRAWFQEGDPLVFAGTTAYGLSTEVFRDLTTVGEADFELFASSGKGLDAVLNRFGGMAAGMHRGTLTRVEPYPVAMPVIVNNEPVLLPAIHSRGTFDGMTVDFYVLDDRDNPLMLRSAGRVVEQIVRLSFPAEPGARALSERLQDHGRVEVYGIYFDFDKATIRPESERAIADIAGVLQENPGWKLRIEGHTDNIGGEGYNLELSSRRAAAVKAALVDRHRISADRLTTDGLGAGKPKASNETLSGRAQNRRVELVRQ